MFKANDFDAKVTSGGIASVFLDETKERGGFIA